MLAGLLGRLVKLLGSGTFVLGKRLTDRNSPGIVSCSGASGPPSDPRLQLRVEKRGEGSPVLREAVSTRPFTWAFRALATVRYSPYVVLVP